METDIPENEVNDVLKEIPEIEYHDGKELFGKKKPKGADYEEAVEATGYGIYNIVFLFVIFPSVMTTYFEPTTMSYIMSSAKCDLNLSLSDKGLLNAVTFMGMITTAIPWGLISDATGRRKNLIVGYFLACLCVIGAATSHNVYQLMVFKFLGGAVISGPFSIFISYFNEFHGKKYRPRIMMFNGICLSVANLILPLLAIAVIPKDWDLFIGDYEFHSWQIFLLITAIPSLISGICICFLPESPKFLMFKGRNDEAMAALQTMYSWNKWKPKEDYPIKYLVNELPEAEIEETYKVSRAYSLTTASIPALHVKKSKVQSILGAMWVQSKPLFKTPYLKLSLHFYLINFLILLGQNTMRLWVPDLFATINEYTTRVGPIDNMCEILEYNVATTQAVTNSTLGECEVLITVDTYFNNIIVALTNIFGYIGITVIVNFFDMKKIIMAALLISTSCGIGLYFAASSIHAVIATSLYTACGSISAVSLMSASVNLFPTSLRTLLLSFCMMVGRLGAIVGNIVFPQLIQLSCIQPFALVTVVMLAGLILTFFLPNSKKNDLK